jgi:hypothetical protein
MRKLILMSVLIVTVVAPWRFAGDPKAQRGMKRTMIFMVLFMVAWAVCGSRLFFMAPAPAD